MAWIEVRGEDEATGRLARIYEQLRRSAGEVANVLAVQSLRPRVLEAHLDLYRTLMFAESDLSRRQREMVAVVVSATNGCHY
ncbi:MAG: carboxymuconolactone decarboxylase family protein [Planctomycetes bacterium]|nr:carboxymuconolactone decarboxylase family protein [Planctomycetota bacterium]